MDTFAGTWTSSAVAGGGSTGPCTGVTYTINKTSDTSGTVTFSGTCDGVTGSGTGNGTLTGSVLNWGASGTVSANGTTCDFSFTNSTATPQADGILVAYKGTVCGIPVSGQQVVRKH